MANVVVKYTDKRSSLKSYDSYKEFPKASLKSAVKFSIEKNGKYFAQYMGEFDGKQHRFSRYNDNDAILEKINKIAEQL